MQVEPRGPVPRSPRINDDFSGDEQIPERPCVKTALLGGVVTVAGFIAVTVVVNELVSRVIEFSLLIGLPAGGLVGVVLGGVTYRWLGDEDPRWRRLGAALVGFGVVFLALLVSLVTVAGLWNSKALPVAGLAGVAVGVGVYLRFRPANRDVAPVGRR